MTQRKWLDVADLAAGLQLQSAVAQAVAQLEMAQQAMAIFSENLRSRYEAPAADGWRIDRWTDGFVMEVHNGTENDQ